MKNSLNIFILSSLFVAGYTHAGVQNMRIMPVASSFLDASHLDLGLRNQWKYLKENEAQPKAVHNAWGQALSLNYRSGYLWDIIGIDATYIRAIKLGASNRFSSRGVLYSSPGGPDKANAHGYSKFSQRYLKLKMGDDTSGMKIKAGWQELTNFGVLTTTNRLSRNSYLGYSGELHWGSLSLDGAYVTRSITRSSPEKVHFLTKTRKPVTSIHTLGINWRQDDASFLYAFGEAKHYLQRHVAEMGYRLTPEWRLTSQIYGSTALDEYKAMPAARRDFDRQAWHYVGDAHWKKDNWDIQTALAYTQASKSNAIGYYDRKLSINNRGRFTALTSAGKDYVRDGELALALCTAYQFLPGLSSGLQLNYGQFRFKDNQVRSGEVTWFNLWKPGKGQLKNLSVLTKFGYGWSYKNNNETPLLNAHGKYMRSPNLSGEIVIDYKFRIF